MAFFTEREDVISEGVPARWVDDPVRKLWSSPCDIWGRWRKCSRATLVYSKGEHRNVDSIGARQAHLRPPLAQQDAVAGPIFRRVPIRDGAPRHTGQDTYFSLDEMRLLHNSEMWVLYLKTRTIRMRGFGTRCHFMHRPYCQSEWQSRIIYWNIQTTTIFTYECIYYFFHLILFNSFLYFRDRASTADWVPSVGKLLCLSPIRIIVSHLNNLPCN